ncbi:MAG: integrase arm-type DNA-binding domain-containing protein [Beijerinckiaceae bacterium]|jgi:integrase|nr:integrase arm-type DNA-binding domain-containing protein [Beijerinckiaceae bacterium]
MALTDTAIRNAKPGEKPRKLSDGDWLFLVVNPNGSKHWRMGYRFDGKESVMSLGSYPGVSLREARDKRDKAKDLLREGKNPNQQKRMDRIAQAVSGANKFELIANELLAKKRRENRAEATIAKTEWLLSFAMPSLATRPITEITAADVLFVLRQVEKRGRHESARRLRSVIGEVFRYAIATARAKDDPTFALRGALTAPAVKHRAAIIEPEAFGGLLRAIDSFDGQPTTKSALQLMALLFPRPGELRMAEWREFDLENATWTIPGSRTKMRREHKVPLARQALAILDGLKALTGRGDLVFPGYGMGSSAGKPVKPRPISENTMNGALRRLGYGPEEMTSHGFRAAASTLLNESGKFSPDAIERALAHQDEDKVRRAYSRGAFWSERVAMAQWWADYLDVLRAKRPADVLQMQKIG